MKQNTNGFDVRQCIHNIAMEWARRDLDEMISQGRISADKTTGCLDCMFDSYVRAYGYLSQKDSTYIKTLLENA